MSPDAKLYIDQMDLASHAGPDCCDLCKVDTFEELVERIRSGRPASGLCPHWPRWKVAALELAARAEEVLPRVPSLEFPRPIDPGLLELGEPGPEAPVLVTGNSEFTQAVMLAVLSLTSSAFRVLFVNTMGHTVDMAMVFKELTAARIKDALEQNGLADGEACSRVILPGLARSLADDLQASAPVQVEAGPVCLAELPLYLGEYWVPAD